MKRTTMKHFNNIRHFREFKEYSQKYIARCLKISQAALSKIENGYIQLSDDRIQQLSEILGVSKEMLYSNEELIMDSKKVAQEGNSINANGKNFYKDNNELLHSLIDMSTDLFNQLSENKKVFKEIKLKQEQIQKQLNVLYSEVIESN